LLFHFRNKIGVFIVIGRLIGDSGVFIEAIGKLLGNVFIRVLVSPDELESLKETIAVSTDTALMRDIKEGLKDLKRSHILSNSSKLTVQSSKCNSQ
jgi:hypothetical protein